MGFFYPCEEPTCGCRLTDTKMQCTTDNTFGELFITQTTAYKWSLSPEWFSPPDSNNTNSTKAAHSHCLPSCPENIQVFYIYF